MTSVTVLVAVYNAEPYLRCCLDSLRAQHLDNWQAVCVDDASTDGSLAVLREYATMDSRIEVISLERNHGQAHARNVALRQACGQYTCFLDADDWLSPDALQLAVAQMDEHTDCVLFDLHYEYADGRSEPYPMAAFEHLAGEEAFLRSIDWQIHGVYMVRTPLHQRFPFDESCRTYSDDNTSRLHFLASRVVRSCKGIYHYRQHASSATHVISVQRFDYLRANESMKRQLLQMKASSQVMSQWETIRLRILVDLYMFYHCHGSELSSADRRYGLGEMHRVWETLEHPLLDPSVCRKFGYRPMPCWTLFRVQEWLYFTLRGMAGKNQ
ncbi:MAG: glycosyltransferase [Prevotella sp.]|nr:glycosyltransferase [Prevotella sp.]